MRLEQIGFARSYDYVPGKSDWTAAGMAREGRSESVLYAGDVLEATPTCYFNDPVEPRLDHLKVYGGDECVVVNDDCIVLGVIDESVQVQPGAKAEEVMKQGPSTVRANEALPDLLQRMEAAGVVSILVTTPEGKLLGTLNAERAWKHLRSG